MTSSTRVWLHGLGSACVGGFAGGLSAALAAPDVFTISTQPGIIKLLRVSLVSAGLLTAAYLKKSPVPDLSMTVDVNQKLEITKE